MKFEQRKAELEKELVESMEKFEIEIYAANVCMPNGEVLPVLKMVDKHEATEEELEEAKKEVKEEKDADKA